MSHPKGPVAVVFGSNSPRAGERDYEDARTLGRTLAQAGHVVATGGYVIGVTTSVFDGVRLSPNAYLDEEIKFPTLFQRLHYLVTMADTWIALPGGIGTLSEVALTWSLLQVGEVRRQPFILVGELWRRTIGEFSTDYYIAPKNRELLKYADTIQEVLALLK